MIKINDCLKVTLPDAVRQWYRDTETNKRERERLVIPAVFEYRNSKSKIGPENTKISDSHGSSLRHTVPAGRIADFYTIDGLFRSVYSDKYIHSHSHFNF